MSQLPTSAHQLFTNLTPITIDGQTVYIAQVRSDSNYALASVGNLGNIPGISPVTCPVSFGTQAQATPMNIQTNMNNVMTITNSGVPSPGGILTMSLPSGNGMSSTPQKQEPMSSPSPSGYMRTVNLQGHKVKICEYLSSYQ